MKPKKWKQLLLLGSGLLVLSLLACACGDTPAATEQAHDDTVSELQPISLDAGEMLKVVATTNILGDVVGQVGGERIDLTIMMDIGVDPHSYVPTPADTAAIHDAHVVFANGVGLEANLQEMLASAGGDAALIYVSDGLEHRLAEGATEEDGHEHEGEEEGLDPHTWFDVRNVIHWVEKIEQALSNLDPANAEAYRTNAAAYTAELETLDTWVVEQVETIPENNRKLVTNHPAFGYLASRYGLEQVGAVYPISPSSEPSAQDIAALQDTIRAYGVPAVFTESTVNPKLAQQVATDTGVRLVALYSGSLGEPGSGAESYIDLIRFDVQAIVDALK